MGNNEIFKWDSIMDEEEWKELRGETLDAALKLLDSEPQLSKTQREDIRLFVDELIMKGFSVPSILMYIYTLIDLGRFFDKDFQTLTERDMKVYVNHLLNHKSNLRSSVRTKMMRIRVFLRWLLNLEGKATPDCMKWFFRMNPRSTKGERKLKLIKSLVKEEDYLKMLKVLKNPRDKALLQFLWESGARILEVLRVKIGDVYLQQKYAIVGGGKRMVPLANNEYIKEWLEKHPNKDDPNAPLFCNLRNPNKSITYSNVKKILRRAAKEAGLDRKVTAHQFRHSRATILAKAGVSPYAMNEVMGWSRSSKMWAVYLHLTQKDAVNEVIRRVNELREK